MPSSSKWTGLAFLAINFCVLPSFSKWTGLGVGPQNFWVHDLSLAQASLLRGYHEAVILLPVPGESAVVTLVISFLVGVLVLVVLVFVTFEFGEGLCGLVLVRLVLVLILWDLFCKLFFHRRQPDLVLLLVSNLLFFHGAGKLRQHGGLVGRVS